MYKAIMSTLKPSLEEVRSYQSAKAFNQTPRSKFYKLLLPRLRVAQLPKSGNG